MADDAAARKPSKQTDADEECEFTDQPHGWAKPYRFLALRYDKAAREKKNDKKKNTKKPDTNEAEQYQLFDTAPYEYRVFVTNMTGSIALLAWFYRQRRSEEHTSELQSQSNLVCRLLLEKKKKEKHKIV